MIMAGRAAEGGASVLLLEKNEKLGRKLAMTGNGRCNLLPADEDNKKLISRYGVNGKFLFSAFNIFDNRKARIFFEGLGLPTRAEEDGRIFPKSGKAGDVIGVLVNYLNKNEVAVRLTTEVKDLTMAGGKISGVILASGEKLTAEYYALCTGGKSFPWLGATGDAYRWLEQAGHQITRPRPALAPIVTKGSIAKKLEGLSFEDAVVDVYVDQKKRASGQGEIIFTAEGISGPVILNLSKDIGGWLEEKEVFLKIDFLPREERGQLDKKLQADFDAKGKKTAVNIISAYVPKRMAQEIMAFAALTAAKEANAVSKEERHKIISWMKEFILPIKNVSGFDRAMITAGGVNIKEVDQRTMRSKIVTNLYLAGEILDIDGPTGGYNLAVCWSTGYLAGNNFLERSMTEDARRQ